MPLFENQIDRARVGAGFSGQCSNNSASGSWYSLPGQGRCRDGAVVGTAGCTWSVIKRIKTIKWSCLDNKLGFNSSQGCGAGPVVVDPVSGIRGYPKAAAILDKGFAQCNDVV
eukprot:COSAG01_NODE_1066_length_11878_cov_244.494949_2_plen_113_part_00